MSGGIAYVYDRHSDFDRKVNYEMVEIEQLDDGDREFLRDMIGRHLEYTGSAVADRMLRAWSVESQQVPQGDADRLQAGARGDGPSGGRRPGRGRDHRTSDGVGACVTGRSSWMCCARRSEPWVRRPDFCKWDREVPKYRPVPVRLKDWKEVYEDFPERQAAGRRPAGAWTVASRSATTAARSAT